jgi:hypothetical protein
VICLFLKKSRGRYEYKNISHASTIVHRQKIFNLFVAGEFEIISNKKIDEIEKISRIKLLKKISYYTELYEWKGKMVFFPYLFLHI